MTKKCEPVPNCLSNINRVMAAVLLVLLGIAFGIVLSVYLFAVDVDLLAVPYLNRGVKLTEDIKVMQDNITIHIPKGSEILFVRRMPSSNEYCLLINSYWDEEKFIEPIESNPKYFEIGEKQ